MSVRFQISLQALQHTHADFLMRHFSTTEAQRDFSLVTIIQKLDQVTQLDVVIAIIGTRAEFNFFNQDNLLLKLGFVRLFLFLILELAIIHQAAHRRLRSRRNFHQINVRLFRQAKGFSQTYDTERLVIDSR